MTANSLFSRTRQRLLNILLMSPDKEFYLRELIRLSEMGQGAVQRELASLVDGEILLRRKDGNRVYYQANKANPIYSELRGLIIKTTGLVEVLRETLKKSASSIDFAFVYGSIVRGEGRATSDIDLMVIGEIAFNEMVKLIGAIQETLGREINPTVYKKVEFKKKLAAGHHFCRSILEGPKLFIIGKEDEFRELTSSRMAGRA